MNNISNFLINAMRRAKYLGSISERRLSTGLRVNSAADDPSAIVRMNEFTSESRGYHAAINNIQSGTSMLQTMDSTLYNVQNIGYRLHDLAVQYNSDAISDKDKSNIQDESKALIGEMQNELNNTTFGGSKVFSKDKYMLQTGPYSKDNIDIDIGKYISPLSAALSQMQNTNTSTNTDNTEKVNPIDNNSNTQNNVSVHQYKLNSPTVNVPENTPDGYNILKYSNNSIYYEGNISNGKADGYGKLYNSKGNLIYEGNWNKGIINGYGELYDNSSQKVYSGTTNLGTPEGYGSYYQNGIIAYQGTFKNGYREGWGTTYDASGKSIDSRNYTDYDDYKTAGSSNFGNTTGSTNNSNGSTAPVSNNSSGSGADTNKDSLNWLNTDYLDKNLLNPLASFRSYIGTQEEILQDRSTLEQNNETIDEGELSKIQDVDTASEILNYSKQQMLQDVNAQLFSEYNDNQRQLILKLIS